MCIHFSWATDTIQCNGKDSHRDDDHDHQNCNSCNMHKMDKIHAY